MITLLTTTMIALIVNTIYSLGPMKLAVNLLAMSLVLVSVMSLGLGFSWFPLIFVLLFTGGILMVFIILSSFLPNEKSVKMKILVLALVLFMITPLTQLKFLGEDKAPDMIKCVLTSSMSTFTIISIMLVYFVMFLEVVHIDKLPMRSSFCQSTTVL